MGLTKSEVDKRSGIFKIVDEESMFTRNFVTLPQISSNKIGLNDDFKHMKLHDIFSK